MLTGLNSVDATCTFADWRALDVITLFSDPTRGTEDATCWMKRSVNTDDDRFTLVTVRVNKTLPDAVRHISLR